MSTETQPLATWEIELGDSLLVDVDLSKNVPCTKDECSELAAWAWHHCCLDSDLCTAHHEHTLKIARRYFDREYECLRCGAYPMPLPTWRPI